MASAENLFPGILNDMTEFTTNHVIKTKNDSAPLYLGTSWW